MTATSRSSSSPWQTPERSRSAPDDEVSRADARRHKHEEARRRQTRLTLVSVAGFLAVSLAGIIYWQYEESVASEAAAVIARDQADLKQELSRFDLSDPAQAQRALVRLEQSQPLWQKWPTASQYADQLIQARAVVAAAHTKQTLDGAIQKLEQQVSAHPQDVATLRSMHDEANAQVEKLKSEATKSANKEAYDRLLACLDNIDTGYLSALQVAIAAAGADQRAARSMLAVAEDLTTAKMEAAEHARDAAARAQWQKAFVGYAKQEDELAIASYGTDAIGKVAWQDLLPGTTTADWAHSSGTSLDHVVKAETIEIGEPSEGGRGGTVVLHGHSWRSCEMEFDVSLQRGAATILLRAGKKADPKQSAAVKFALAESPKALLLSADQTVHVDMLVLGDQLTVHVGSEEHKFAVPAGARSGGFGVVIDAGTALRLSHLRVRNLE